jgi:hypothetical protein
MKNTDLQEARGFNIKFAAFATLAFVLGWALFVTYAKREPAEKPPMETNEVVQTKTLAQAEISNPAMALEEESPKSGPGITFEFDLSTLAKVPEPRGVGTSDTTSQQ